MQYKPPYSIKTALAVTKERLRTALALLMEVESMMGTETTTMFMDVVDPEQRLRWLRILRGFLRENGVEPENLSGRWHT